LQCVARRIVDRAMLHLIKLWLKVPVEERDESGKRHMTGGKENTRGTPQGGVISPLLANIYMNRFLKFWRTTGRGEAFNATIVNYADDFVILSRGYAAEALDWTRDVMGRVKLTLNEAKTSIKQARQECYDFLGYTFGKHRSWKGFWYLAAKPSKKSIARLRQKVNDVLCPQNTAPWQEVRGKLNSILRGWSRYFSYGTCIEAYRSVDHHVYDRVRGFLRRRHKVQSRGTRRFTHSVLYKELGVVQLVRPAAPSVS
jgi:RNA-directed DNA polymerase